MSFAVGEKEKCFQGDGISMHAVQLPTAEKDSICQPGKNMPYLEASLGNELVVRGHHGGRAPDDAATLCHCS